VRHLFAGRLGRELSSQEVEALVRRGQESYDTIFYERLDLGSDADRARFFRDVAALANGEGGQIIVGVDGEGNPVGLEDRLSEHSLKQALTAFFGGRLELRYQEHVLSDGSKVGLIYVPEYGLHVVIAPKSLTPEGGPAIHEGDIHCRMGAVTARADGRALNQMVADVLAYRAYVPVQTRPGWGGRRPEEKEMPVGRRLSQRQLERIVRRGRQSREIAFLEKVDLDTWAGRRTFLTTVAGLANAEGGYIIVGMDERGRRVEVPAEEPVPKDDIQEFLGYHLGEDLPLEFSRCILGEGPSFDIIFVRGQDCVVVTAQPCGDPEGPEDNYVREGEVYYRRGAETVRAGTREFEAIMKKIISAKDLVKQVEF